MASTRSSRKGGRVPAAVGALAFALICVLAVLCSFLRTQDLQPKGRDISRSDVSDGDVQCDGDQCEGANLTSGGVGPDDKGEAIEQTLRDLAKDGDSCSSEERVATELRESASEVLGRYSKEEACLLLSAGYLDCLGEVWGCVTEGLGWVDVCVIEEQEDNTCVVRTIRLEAGREDQGDAN